MRRVFAALLLLAPAPALAQAESRELWLRNDCAHPVRMFVRWKDPAKGWLVIGPYNFEPNAAVTALGAADANMRHVANSEVDIYASSTDGANLRWSGNEQVTFDTVTYRMMPAVLQANEGHDLIALGCTTPAEGATMAAAEDDFNGDLGFGPPSAPASGGETARADWLRLEDQSGYAWYVAPDTATRNGQKRTVTARQVLLSDGSERTQTVSIGCDGGGGAMHGGSASDDRAAAALSAVMPRSTTSSVSAFVEIGSGSRNPAMRWLRKGC